MKTETAGSAGGGDVTIRNNDGKNESPEESEGVALTNRLRLGILVSRSVDKMI